MTIETMDTDAHTEPMRDNQAWLNARSSLAAVQASMESKSTDSGVAPQNSSDNTQSFITSEQQGPQLPTQQYMTQNQFSYGYQVAPPPPPPGSFGLYQPPYSPNHQPQNNQQNYGRPRASYSSHFSQPPPGVRFSLTNQNRFQNNQMRYRPPRNKPPQMQQSYMGAWRPGGGGGHAAAPPLPPPNPSYQANQNQREQPMEHDTLDSRADHSTYNQQPTQHKHSLPPPNHPQAQAKPAPPADTTPQMSDWPPAMKSWVTRCFAAASSDDDKDKMERKLKEVITDSFARDRVKTTDWDTYPIPQLVEASLAMQAGVNSRLGSPPFQGGRGRGKKGRGRGNRGSPRGMSRFDTPSHRGKERSRSRSSSRYSRSSRSRSRDRYSRRRKSTRDRSRSRSRSSSRSSGSSRSAEDFIPLHSKVSKKLWKNNKQKPKGGPVAKRLGVKHKKGRGAPQYKPTARDKVNIQKRMARFGEQLHVRSEPLQLAINTYANDDGEDVEWDENHKIVGTCRSIEKEYLRLTSAPAASSVRPLEVLYKSLEHVKAKWVQKGDYRWTCEQFKSIRQDLTVQCIRDEFTVKVYETHARVSLEASDHCEFNQCQTQLKALYSEGVEGCRLEFTAYRILYYVFTTNTIDMISALSSLAMEEKLDSCVSFALAFRSAWSLNNYHQMLKLYRAAPKMAGHVIELFLTRERMQALKTMVKAYRPSVTIQFVQTELGYDDSNEDRDFLLKFLLEQGANLTADSSKIDCKNGLNPPPMET